MEEAQKDVQKEELTELVKQIARKSDYYADLSKIGMFEKVAVAKKKPLDVKLDKALSMISSGAYDYTIYLEIKDDFEPISELQSFIHAVALNNKDAVDKILKDHPNPNPNELFQSDSSLTPMQILVAGGTKDMAKHLLKQKELDISFANAGAMRLLNFAVANKNLGMMEFLVEQGAYVDQKDADGNTALHVVSIIGEKEIAEFLISKGADVNAKNIVGQTPLEQAVGQGHLDVMDLLLANKANLDVVDKGGKSLIHVAAAFRQPEALKKLLDLGVKINQKDSDDHNALFNAVWFDLGIDMTKDGRSQEQLDKQLIEVVDVLLGHGASTSDKWQSNAFPGFTLLHKAALDGNVDLSKVLIEKGKMDVDAVDSNNNTPLLYAAVRGYLDEVELLLKENANPNGSDASKTNPLCQAIIANNLKIAGELLDFGADINKAEKSYDAYNATPLFIAVSKGNKEAVDLLLERKADTSQPINKGGDVMLHDLIAKDDLDMAAKFVEHGAKISAANKFGIRAIHKAAYFGKLEPIEFLTSKGANLNAEDSVQKTPLHYASEANNPSAIDYLVSDERKEKSDIEAQNNIGMTPFLTSIFHSSIGAMEVLAAKGANLNAKFLNDKTAVHIAAFKNNMEVLDKLEQLVGSDLNLDAKDSDGTTPLMIAAIEGSLAALKWMSEHGANIKAVDLEGNSVIHYAAANNSPEIVKFALEKNIDPCAKNNEGKSAFDLAKELDHNVIKTTFIVEHGACPEEHNIEVTGALGAEALEFHS